MLQEMHGLSSNDEVLYPVAKDVVCGMRISVSQAGGTEVYDGGRYYFCASGCHEAFQANPQQYVNRKVVLHG